MKKYFYIMGFGLFFTVAHSQVLYTEDFDSYSPGPVGTDDTGITQGRGGWYTHNYDFYNYPVPLSASDFQIEPEPGRGNVLKVASAFEAIPIARYVFRDDLQTHWQQRAPGNNVLKFSVDLYTSDKGAGASVSRGNPSVNIYLLNKKKDVLGGYQYTTAYDSPSFLSGYNTAFLNTGLVDPDLYRYGSLLPYFDFLRRPDGSSYPLYMPSNEWVALEFYVDYNTSKLYFSIPSTGYTFVYDAMFPLVLDHLGQEGHDDSPDGLILSFGSGSWFPKTREYFPKFDNISISAQNTVPTVGVKEELSGRFSLYPNPASETVVVAGRENMFIKGTEIYDASGRKVAAERFDNKTEVQLNVSHLETGVYLLHLETNEGTAVKKLVKK